jgi:hypothetical protein
MTHINPTFITGKIIIGDIATATGDLTVEGSTCIESATVLSNQNDSLVIEVKLHELDDAMLCFTQILDNNATESSGQVDVVVKQVIDITTFVLQAQYSNVINNNTILQLLFVKNSLG